MSTKEKMKETARDVRHYINHVMRNVFDKNGNTAVEIKYYVVTRNCEYEMAITISETDEGVKEHLRTVTRPRDIWTKNSIGFSGKLFRIDPPLTDAEWFNYQPLHLIRKRLEDNGCVENMYVVHQLKNSFFVAGERFSIILMVKKL